MVVLFGFGLGYVVWVGLGFVVLWCVVMFGLLVVGVVVGCFVCLFGRLIVCVACCLLGWFYMMHLV